MDASSLGLQPGHATPVAYTSISSIKHCNHNNRTFWLLGSYCRLSASGCSTSRNANVDVLRGCSTSRNANASVQHQRARWHTTGHDDVCALLLKRGADPKVTNEGPHDVFPCLPTPSGCKFAAHNPRWSSGTRLCAHLSVRTRPDHGICLDFVEPKINHVFVSH